MSDKYKRYEEMWIQQVEFMKLLQEKRKFPDFPVDITSKPGQKVIKDTSHECMHELFEAVQLLKNSKDHRATDIREFDRNKFLEELSDSLHYFIEVCILAGISADDLFNAYMNKGQINIERINSGY